MNILARHGLGGFRSTAHPVPTTLGKAEVAVLISEGKVGPESEVPGLSSLGVGLVCQTLLTQG